MYRYHTIWLFTAALLIAACSSDGTVSEEKKEVVEERLPMTFSSSLTSSTAATTRSSSLQTLYDDFKVGVWKSFGNTAQQNVMDGYRVAYSATTSKWDYVGIGTQIQRYWDLSAFPYEFRAVAPHFAGATLAADKITLDVSSRPFKAQTLIDDVYNVTDAESEPCVVAHVNRQKQGDNYVDQDVIANEEINDVSKTVATREVRMPFHHLISKVGFRIYIDDPQPTVLDYVVKLNNITISAVKTGFISESKTYTATAAQGLGTGTFASSSTSDEFILLQHRLYQVPDDNDNLVDLNLRNYLSREHTFDLCPKYLQQIPQEDLKIHIQLQMLVVSTPGGTLLETINYDRLLSFNRTVTTGDLFTWEPEKRYIYTLRIPNLQAHDIYIETCEVLPWDEAVQSSDIPIEL